MVNFNIPTWNFCCCSSESNIAQTQHAQAPATDGQNAQAQRGAGDTPRPLTTIPATPSRASYPHDHSRAASIRKSIDGPLPLNPAGDPASKVVAHQASSFRQTAAAPVADASTSALVLESSPEDLSPFENLPPEIHLEIAATLEDEDPKAILAWSGASKTMRGIIEGFGYPELNRLEYQARTTDWSDPGKKSEMLAKLEAAAADEKAPYTSAQRQRLLSISRVKGNDWSDPEATRAMLAERCAAAANPSARFTSAQRFRILSPLVKDLQEDDVQSEIYRNLDRPEMRTQLSAFASDLMTIFSDNTNPISSEQHRDIFRFVVNTRKKILAATRNEAAWAVPQFGLPVLIFQAMQFNNG